MKYLISSFLFLIGISVHAQCPTGDVQLKTQAEVYAFKRLYPNCNRIYGDLIIGDVVRNDIRDLNPLSNIMHIDSNLKILNCIALDNVNQMGAIRYIGKDIKIESLTRLMDIPFLYNLDTIHGDALFYELPALENLDFLSNVKEIKGSLDILRCSGEMHNKYSITRIGLGINFSELHSLTTLNSFESLREVKFIYLNNCPSLINLSGLKNINPKSITSLAIQYNPKLNDCNIESFCDAIQVPSGVFVQISNNAYTCRKDEIIRFCNNGQSICPSDDVYINGQSDLVRFQMEYPECESMEYNIFINSLQEDEISDLTPLVKLKKCKGIIIKNTKTLLDLSGLSNLQQVEYLSLANNEKLLNLNGLQNVRKLSRFIIEANNSLEDISAINFESISVLGYITFSHNNILQNIHPVSKLDSIKGYLYIGDTDAITDLGQLDGIKFINELSIRRINNLEKINDFDQAVTIQNLDLGFCPKLNIIEFNEKIKIGNDLIISYNPLLDKCKFLNLPDSLETFSFVNNENITSIEAGGSLQNITSVSIFGCHKLQNFLIPISLKSIDNFFINYNQNFLSLKGGDSLNKIGELNIINNYNLSDISGLDHNISIFALNISNNSNLSNCAIQPLCQLPNLNQVTIQNNNGNCHSLVSALNHCPNQSRNPIGDVTIYDANSLEKFKTDYPNADSIYGNLIFLNANDVEGSDLNYFTQIKFIDSALILNNCKFDNIQSFKDIEFTGLEIVSCPNLTSLPLFSKLKQADFLKIINCESIKNLEGLSFLTDAGDINLHYLDSLINLKGLDQLKFADNIDFNSLPIVNLGPLNNLEKIKGRLSINECNELLHLKNMANLKSIGSLEIRDNLQLRSLLPFKCLDSLRDGIVVYSCQSLDSITGFERVKLMENNIYVAHNPALDYLSFDSLIRVGNILINNNQLVKLNFPKLKKVKKFILTDNFNIQDIGNLENLELIEMELRIEKNKDLKNIDGVNPNVVFGELRLVNNEKLSICNVPFICNALYTGQKISLWNNGLDCQIEAEVEQKCGFNPKACPSSDVWITNNATSNLYNQYYSNCTVVNGDFNLYNNLSVHPNIENIKIIVSNLTIQLLSGLQNLNFINLNEIDNELSIAESRDLKYCEFPSLGYHSFLRLTVSGNKHMLQTPKFENLRMGSGNTIIYDNDNILTIEGFNRIGQPNYILIENNPKLESITGIKGLDTINLHYSPGLFNQMVINNNKNLTDISGLSYPFYRQRISITNNPMLSQCAVEGICHHLLINQNTVVSNNGFGCNSPEEVEQACIFVGTEDESKLNEFKIYPNPTSGIILIEFEDPLKRISLFNSTGVPYELTPGPIVDLSGFSSGIYFLKLYGAKQSIIYKVVKI